MTEDLMERIEGCIANAEHDDEHETFIDARDKINAQAAEIERLRNWSLKALTVVLCGEGWIMSYPHYDADDLLCDGVELLGVYSAEDARAALGETK